METAPEKTIDGACHCGRVSFRFRGDPGGATACNCTVCRRYGTLWIYGYEGHEISVDGPTKSYGRDKRHLDFHFCGECGCVVCWRSNSVGADSKRRIAVNVRLCEPDAVADLPIDHFDGLGTFDDLPRDGRTVHDYWF